MLATYAFTVVSAAAVVSMLMIFISRRMLYAMLSFSSLLICIALLLVILGLPLLALLQLFIMVGGVSTYLFVGVSSENLSRFKHTGLPILLVLSIALVALPLYRLSGVQLGSGSYVLTSSFIAQSVRADLALFYMIALMLFGVGIGSIIIIKMLARE